MEQIYTLATTENLLIVVSIGVALIGVAMLLHIRKEPRDAHGKTRN